MTEAVTEAMPERRIRDPHPSRLARFLGRWTTGGHFRPNKASAASHTLDGELDLPRDTIGRNVLLVLAIAAMTFLITFAIMKWRQPHPGPLPPAPQHAGHG